MENVKRVVLVGAGGIGTWLSEGVVRLLEWKFPGSALLIVDGDNFEQKNLERQSFTQMGNKASVKALELTEKFHQTLVIPVPKCEMSCQERAEVEGGTQILATNMAVAAMILGRIQHTIVLEQNPEQSEIYFDLALGMAQPYNRMVESTISVS